MRFIRDLLLGAALFIAIFAASKAYGEAPYPLLSQSVIKLMDTAGTMGGTGFVTQLPGHTPVTVTNWHLCMTSTDEHLEASRDGEFKISIKILYKSPEDDLCILELVPGRVIKLGKPAKNLEQLYTIGHPGFSTQTPHTGFMVGEVDADLAVPLFTGCESGYTPTIMPGYDIICIHKFHLIDTTIPSAPGASGSPVVTANGELVGVINSTRATVDGLHGTMLSVDSLIKFMRKVL